MYSKETISIHLGSSHICVAAWLDKDTSATMNEQPESLTSSVVPLSSPGIRVLFAKPVQSMVPENVIYDYMELLDHPFGCSYEKQNMNALVPPHQQCKEVLQQIKSLAQSFLEWSVKNAVVILPVTAHVKAIQDAAQGAGFNVVDILLEPCAAIRAYQIPLHLQREVYYILVVSLNKMALDICVVKLQANTMELKVAETDVALGAKKFVDNLMNCFEDGNFDAQNRLRLQCEAALKTKHGAELTGSMNLSEYSNHTLFSNCKDKVLDCVEKAKIHHPDVGDVLIGEYAGMPGFEEIFHESFYNVNVYCSLDPVHVAAIGGLVYLGPNPTADLNSAFQPKIISNSGLDSAFQEFYSKVSGSFTELQQQLAMATGKVSENLKRLSNLGFGYLSVSEAESEDLEELLEKLTIAVDAVKTQKVGLVSKERRLSQTLTYCHIIGRRLLRLGEMNYLASKLCSVLNDPDNYNFEGFDDIQNLQKNIASLTAEATHEKCLQKQISELSVAHLLAKQQSELRVLYEEKKQQLLSLAPLFNTAARDLYNQFQNFQKQFEKINFAKHLSDPPEKLDRQSVIIAALNSRIEEHARKWIEVAEHIHNLPVDLQSFLEASANFSLHKDMTLRFLEF